MQHWQRRCTTGTSHSHLHFWTANIGTNVRSGLGTRPSPVPACIQHQNHTCYLKLIWFAKCIMPCTWKWLLPWSIYYQKATLMLRSHRHGQSWTVLGCNLCSCTLFIGVTPSPALTQQNKRYAHSSYSLVHMCAVRKSCYLLFCQLSMCNGMSQHLDLPFRDPHTLVCLHYLHLQFCECLCICI